MTYYDILWPCFNTASIVKLWRWSSGTWKPVRCPRPSTAAWLWMVWRIHEFGGFTMIQSIQCQFGQWRPSKLSHSWTKRKKFCESKIMKRSWSDFQWFISSALSILAKIGLLGQVNITWHNAWTWIGTMTWSWLVPSSLGTCRFGPQKSHWLVDGKGGPTFFHH